MSIDHHLSNSAAGAMSEDASTGLGGGTVGLERETTEWLLSVDQKVVDDLQVSGLDEVGFARSDPITKGAEMDGLIRRTLHGTGKIRMVDGENGMTQ